MSTPTLATVAEAAEAARCVLGRRWASSHPACRWCEYPPDVLETALRAYDTAAALTVEPPAAARIVPFLTPSRSVLSQAAIISAGIRAGLEPGDVIAEAERLYPMVDPRGFTPRMWSAVWEEVCRRRIAPGRTA